MKSVQKGYKQKASILKIDSVLFASILLFLSACNTTPLEDALDNFALVLELEEVENVVSLQFKDAATGELIDQEVEIVFTGMGSSGLIDMYSDPITSKTTRSGFLNIGYNGSSTPSNENPVELFVHYSVPGYLSGVQPMTLTSPTFNSLTIPLISISQPPPGFNVTTVGIGSTGNDGTTSSPITINADGISTLYEADLTITIPAGSTLLDENGTPLSGSLTAEITTIALDEITTYGPVDFLNQEFEDYSIEIASAFNFVVRDGSGRALSSVEPAEGEQGILFDFFYSSDDSLGQTDALFFSTIGSDEIVELTLSDSVSSSKAVDLIAHHSQTSRRQKSAISSSLFPRTLSGGRAYVRGRPGIEVEVGAISDKPREGEITPYLRFPGQISYMQVSARIRFTSKSWDEQGNGLYITDGFWSRRTGKKLYLYFLYNDNGLYRTSQRKIYPARKENFESVQKTLNGGHLLDLTSNDLTEVTVNLNFECTNSTERLRVKSIPTAVIQYESMEEAEIQGYISVANTTFEYDATSQALVGGSFTFYANLGSQYLFRTVYDSETFSKLIEINSANVTLTQIVDSDLCR